MYWEEVALGYDAYSISQTGLDHHGNKLPVVAFESFGDWKPALYFYTIVPFIRLLGLNVWAVRMPSLLAGIFTVLGVGFLTKWVLLKLNEAKDKHFNFKIDWMVVLGSGVATFSPWLINFARGGWESNLATAFLLWGALFLLKPGKYKWQILGVLLLVFSMYTYHAARVIAPGLLLLILGFKYIWQINTSQNILMVVKNIIERVGKLKKSFFLVGLLFCLSLPFFLPGASDKVGHRFAETSIFGNLEPIIESNLRQERAGHTLLSRVVFHRYRYIGKQLATNFLTHFSPDYLFLSGDINPRHNPGIGGVILPINALFLIWGIFIIISKNKKLALFLFAWICLCILPAATSNAVPHALRTLASAPIWLGIISVGWWYALSKLQQLPTSGFIKKTVLFVAVGSYVILFARYYLFYIEVYPKLSSQNWQYGYEQVIQIVSQLEKDNPSYPVYISRKQGRPAIYYWFFTQTDPTTVQKLEEKVKKDQGEFLEFENKVFFDKTDVLPTEKAIVALTHEEYQSNTLFSNNASEVMQVNNLENQPIWYVLKLK